MKKNQNKTKQNKKQQQQQQKRGRLNEQYFEQARTYKSKIKASRSFKWVTKIHIIIWPMYIQNRPKPNT